MQAAIHRSGLGNNELAELMGVAPSTVSRWMYGTHAPAPHRLLELDKILKSRGVDLLHNAR